MKKALILSPFFYPEPISTGKYNTDLAQSLVQAGYELTILCSHPIYPSWVPSESNAQLEGMKIVRGGGINRYPSHPMLRRLVLEVWFALFVFHKIWSQKERFDLVIPVFPPSLMAISLKLFSRRLGRIVGIVHDLQAAHLSASGGVLKKVLTFFINVVEKRAFLTCDSIIYLSSEMRLAASEKFNISLQKSSVVYPFVNVTGFVDEGRLDHVFDRNKKAVVYSGALGDKQCPDKLYGLAVMLTAKRDDLVFYFFSDGPNYLRLKDGNDNTSVRFNKLVAEEDVGELLTRSDIQILPQAPGTASASLPSKLPNILASGTPLFVITDPKSEIEILLSRVKGCVVSNTWDAGVNCEHIFKMLDISVKSVVDNDVMSLFQKDRLIDLMHE